MSRHLQDRQRHRRGDHRLAPELEAGLKVVKAQTAGASGAAIEAELVLGEALAELGSVDRALLLGIEAGLEASGILVATGCRAFALREARERNSVGTLGAE